MTKEDTLKGRLELLFDLGCIADENILYVPSDSTLDINLTFLKYLNKKRFTSYLLKVQTVYTNK
jgi:hypothetical protein